MERIIFDAETVENINLDSDGDGANSMSNLQVVKNIEVAIEENKLKIEVDLDVESGKTKRGKTQIATTRGNKFYTLNEDAGLGCALSLTVYKD